MGVVKQTPTQMQIRLKGHLRSQTTLAEHLRLGQLAEHLSNLLAAIPWRIDLIVIEDNRHLIHGNAQRRLSSLSVQRCIGVIWSMLYLNHLAATDMILLTPQSVRKTLGLAQTCTKAQVHAQLSQLNLIQTGCQLDEADAVGLAYTAITRVSEKSHG